MEYIVQTQRKMPDKKTEMQNILVKRNEAVLRRGHKETIGIEGLYRQDTLFPVFNLTAAGYSGHTADPMLQTCTLLSSKGHYLSWLYCFG